MAPHVQVKSRMVNSVVGLEQTRVDSIVTLVIAHSSCVPLSDGNVEGAD